MAKTNEPQLDDWGDHVVPRGRNQNKPATACCVSAINKGRVLAVYPSDEIVALMADWPKVNADFRANGENALKAIELTRSDGVGLNIRHYDSQRANIHVRVPGDVLAKCQNGGQQVCEHKIDGDAVLIRIPETISFAPREA